MFGLFCTGYEEGMRRVRASGAWLRGAAQCCAAGRPGWAQIRGQRAILSSRGSVSAGLDFRYAHSSRLSQAEPGCADQPASPGRDAEGNLLNSARLAVQPAASVQQGPISLDVEVTSDHVP